MDSGKFEVRVFDHDKVIYQGMVWAVSSFNDIGPFDVLGMHTNFITVIKDKLVLHLTEDNQREVTIDRGVMRVFAQNAEVYLGIGSADLAG